MWLSDGDYQRIYGEVPRLCVDVVLVSEKGVVLEKRRMDPDMGWWSVIGGTFYREETFEEACKRIARDDWGIEIKVVKFLGVIEFMGERERLIDNRHSVALCFECRADEGAVQKLVEEREDVAVFEVLPERISWQHEELMMSELGMWCEGWPKILGVDLPKVEVKGRMPYEEFVWIYQRVPRLCVETIVLNEKDEVLLTLRGIEPYKGWWHLPGGSVMKGELLEEAAKRMVKHELGVEVELERMLAPVRYTKMPGDEIDQVAVGVIFVARIVGGTLTLDEQGEEWGWFGKLPENTIPAHAVEVRRSQL